MSDWLVTYQERMFDGDFVRQYEPLGAKQDVEGRCAQLGKMMAYGRVREVCVYKLEQEAGEEELYAARDQEEDRITSEHDGQWQKLLARFESGEIFGESCLGKRWRVVGRRQSQRALMEPGAVKEIGRMQLKGIINAWRLKGYMKEIPKGMVFLSRRTLKTLFCCGPTIRPNGFEGFADDDYAIRCAFAAMNDLKIW